MKPQKPRNIRHVQLLKVITTRNYQFLAHYTAKNYPSKASGPKSHFASL